MTMPCMCGDSECPSCGTAQGTRTMPSDPTIDLEQLERLILSGLDPSSIEVHQCAKCGNYVRVPSDLEFEIGDWCYGCNTALADKIRPILPALIAFARDAAGLLERIREYNLGELDEQIVNDIDALLARVRVRADQ